MCSRSMSVLLSPSSSASFKFIIYLLIVLAGVQLIDAFCDEHHWWQQELNKCIPCTRCDDSQLIVLRPCQKHSDTVCGTLDDVELELGWLKAAAVAAEQKQVSKLTIDAIFIYIRTQDDNLFNSIFELSNKNLFDLCV